MARLSPESLSFARTHITRYWDSDFFLKPFEFDALWAHWPDVVEYLTASDIENIPARAARTMVAPKPDGGYRVVHQLDPLNSLVYTALVWNLAGVIELGRLPREDRVACSYRIDVDDENGRFFSSGRGFDDFVAKARELAAQYSHVLAVDITDFYNQIYLHRLQNAIAAADPSMESYASELEGFLTRINNGASRGVPVGPSASIIMAEAVLMDVDNFIRNTRFEHTRYVDDFYIFGASHSELAELQRELILYLHSNHRLTLADHKTKIHTSLTFTAGVLEDPEVLERDRIHRILDERIVPIEGYAFLGADEAERTIANADVEARSEVLRDLMGQVCDMSVLDLGLARHVLRSCRKLRLRAIVPQLLEHFDFFSPVINDVVLYLRAVTNREFLRRQADRFEEIARTSQTLDIPLVASWFFDYIIGQSYLIQQRRFQEAIQRRAPFQARAAMARETRNVAWVRQYRDRLDELGAWDRRQVIRSAGILARDERRAWLGNVAANSTNPVDRWVARWVAAQ